MWSGPRNISTALMRSWGQRADTAVCDEPLYGHYLLHTGRTHPGAEEVIAHHETDWRRAVAALLGEVPGGKAIFYQKHMAHHLLPHIDRGWLGEVTNAFLIRHPREMLPSLDKHVPDPSLEDTGLPQQVEIFEMVRERTGRVPPVIDAKDVLQNPRGVLSRLCEALGVAFDEAMLSWPPGRRETDGIWAKYWYENVEKSTTFQPYTPKVEPLNEHLQRLLARCLGYYETLYQHRITAEG
ncbi:MAG: HAD family hydrolase [Isosphaeraceae bacterium]|nr:HAD family hydrolase [Isosphaeraceae bacterium]